MDIENQTIVYINRHPEYDYAMAVLDGYVELRDYVAEKDYLCWERQHKKDGLMQVMICGKDKYPERLDEFIKHVKNGGARVMIRDKRGCKWEEI